MIKLIRALNVTLNSKSEGKTFNGKNRRLACIMAGVHQGPVEASCKLSGKLKNKEDIPSMIAVRRLEGL